MPTAQINIKDYCTYYTYTMLCIHTTYVHRLCKYLIPTVSIRTYIQLLSMSMDKTLRCYFSFLILLLVVGETVGTSFVFSFDTQTSR